MRGAGRTGTRSLVGIWCAATLCWAGFESAPVLAGELAYGGGYSLAYDTNITRVPFDPVADFTQTLFAGFGYQERTATVVARVQAQAERRDYLRHTYVDENAYYADASVVWTISPRKLAWIFEDYASQVPISLVTVDTPNNRTNANSFSTGPELTFRLTSVDSALLGARYGRLNIDGPGDNEYASAYARGQHQLSQTSNLSLNYLATRVNFQDPEAFSNYALEAWWLGYEFRPYTSGVRLEAGTARIQQDRLETPPPGRYGRLSLLYQITPESGLSASADSAYSDTAIDLLGGVSSATQSPSAPSRITPTSAVTGPYFSRRADLSFDHRGPRFQVTARGYARSVDYLQSNESYEERDGRFEFFWLTGATRVRVYAEYLRRDFLDFFQQDRLRASSVSVTYRASRVMNVSVELGRFGAFSTAPANNYVDYRLSLTLSFSTGPLYTAASRR